MATALDSVQPNIYCANVLVSLPVPGTQTGEKMQPNLRSFIALEASFEMEKMSDACS
jgi:hypothetical protein